jgi:hypothetical protein
MEQSFKILFLLYHNPQHKEALKSILSVHHNYYEGLVELAKNHIPTPQRGVLEDKTELNAALRRLMYHEIRHNKKPLDEMAQNISQKILKHMPVEEKDECHADVKELLELLKNCDYRASRKSKEQKKKQRGELRIKNDTKKIAFLEFLFDVFKKYPRPLKNAFISNSPMNQLSPYFPKRIYEVFGDKEGISTTFSNFMNTHIRNNSYSIEEQCNRLASIILINTPQDQKASETNKFYDLVAILNEYANRSSKKSKNFNAVPPSFIEPEVDPDLGFFPEDDKSFIPQELQ